eukprot:481032-Pyramimonas_sp.AAC.1
MKRSTLRHPMCATAIRRRRGWTRRVSAVRHRLLRNRVTRCPLRRRFQPRRPMHHAGAAGPRRRRQR